MTAFFFLFDRTRSEISERLAEHMLDAVDLTFTDVRVIKRMGKVAFGYAGQWVTNEQVGEEQPLYCKESESFLLFDGRVDNRDHLYRALSPEKAGENFTDAMLVHQYLNRFGLGGLKDVVGPFALAWYRAEQQRLVVARDVMASRHLVFKQTDDLLIVSNQELCLAAHPEIAYELNSLKVARAITYQSESEPTAHLQGISVTKPGQWQEWQLGSNPVLISDCFFYRISPKTRIELKSDAAYASEFRRLLHQAVRRRLRSRGSVGTLLSGGLDSVPMSIAAAQNYNDHRNVLQAFSWVFYDHPQQDERCYSVPVCKEFGIRQHLIACDDVWPKFDGQAHTNPLFPLSLPYIEYQSLTFQLAQQTGVSVMLSGLDGDLLYQADSRDLVDPLSRLRFRTAWEVFTHLVNERSLGEVFKRFLVKPLLPNWALQLLTKNEPDLTVLHGELAQAVYEQDQQHWLSDYAKSARRPLQYLVMLDGTAGDDIFKGRVLESRYGIERRYPYRDRELCEFMLAIPTEQLRLIDEVRPIVKRAFADELPSELLVRNDKTRFADVLFKNMAVDQNAQRWFESSRDAWSRLVDPDYFARSAGNPELQSFTKWQCAFYGFWKSVCYTQNLVRLESFDHEE